MKIDIGPYKENRKENITIHPYDTWNLDNTLAKIIVPCLKQLKETTHGAPNTDNEDVPECLRGEGCFENGDVDDKFFDRWDYILDEMIWAFEQIADDEKENPAFYDDPDAKFGVSIDHYLLNVYEERISNGLRLFGKYYRGLWD